MPETLIFIGTPGRNRTCLRVPQRGSTCLKPALFGDRFSLRTDQNGKSGAKLAHLRQANPTSLGLTATSTWEGGQKC